MAKLPHEKYLVTLIVGKYSNQEIFQDLKKVSLPIPPISELDNLRDEVTQTNKAYFRSAKSKVNPDLEWLKELGIEAMFGYLFNYQVFEDIEPLKKAFKVIDDKQLYKILTSLAVANVSNEDLELIVNSKFDIEYSSQELDAFLYYFFNIKDYSLFERHTLKDSTKDQELRLYYTMALESDKDYLMWKLGIAPSKSFGDMLNEMAVDSFYNFKEQATRNQDQAQKWANVMLKVHERLDKVEKELNEAEDMKEDFMKIFGSDDKLKKEKQKSVENPDTSTEGDLDLFSGDTKETPKMVSLEDLN